MQFLTGPAAPRPWCERVHLLLVRLAFAAAQPARRLEPDDGPYRGADKKSRGHGCGHGGGVSAAVSCRACICARGWLRGGDEAHALDQAGPVHHLLDGGRGDDTLLFHACDHKHDSHLLVGNGRVELGVRHVDQQARRAVGKDDGAFEVTQVSAAAAAAAAAAARARLVGPAAAGVGRARRARVAVGALQHHVLDVGGIEAGFGDDLRTVRLPPAVSRVCQ